jgi:S1-C subfamily serine protease
MKCKNCEAEIKDNNKFCTSCGTSVEIEKPSSSPTKEIFKELNKTQFKNNYKISKPRLIWGAIVVGLIILGIFSGNSPSSNSTPSASNNSNSQTIETSNKAVNTTRSQSQVAKTIINILCPYGDSGSGGSGTILYSNGLILTNNHIVPQDKNENPLVDNCLVTLPDPNTGKVKEIYNAKPLIVPILSKEYDLAFMSIDSPYVDENGIVYGNYSNNFTSQLDDGCENDNPTLGEKVKVFGYPAISGGGYYLTITEGIVSSLPNDGTIVTSAKVSHGNSGGIAVDENGCMIGVPSMFDSDEAGSLGIIISNNIVAEFLKKLQALIELTK